MFRLSWNQPADNRNKWFWCLRTCGACRPGTALSPSSTITRELAAFWNTYCHHFPFTVAWKLRHKEVHELPQRYIVNKFNSTPKTTLLTTSHASWAFFKLQHFIHVMWKRKTRRLPAHYLYDVQITASGKGPLCRCRHAAIAHHVKPGAGRSTGWNDSLRGPPAVPEVLT